MIRDPNKSNSELGQWVHDTLPRTMYFIDLDGVVFKKATRILRIVEQKQYGQQVKPSQNAILPLLQLAIQHLIDTGEVSPESGVFIVWVEAPFNEAYVQHINDDHYELLSKSQWIKFISGDSLR